MRPQEFKNEVDGPELSEKLMFVEDIWGSIASSNSDLPIPEWQKKELETRYKEYKDGHLKLHDWKKIHEGLRDKYK